MEATMTSGETLLRIGRGMKELTRGLTELSDMLDANGVGARGRFQAELVFEEMVTNVIRYGYDDEELHIVDVTVSVTDDDVVMVVSDDGKPFNPLERADPAAPTSLADAQIGGLGIMLVRKAARDVSYARTDGRNLLTVLIARD
jgi:anti-sigma regulatory factor (Ser/Thr protein kinase)